MTLIKYNNVDQATAQLKKRGYIMQFHLTRLGIYSRATNKYYQPEDLTIDELYRFRGAIKTNFDTVIFALSCDDGSQGIIKAPGGSLPDLHLLSFMNKVKVREWQN